MKSRRANLTWTRRRTDDEFEAMKKERVSPMHAVIGFDRINPYGESGAWSVKLTDYVFHTPEDWSARVSYIFPAAPHENLFTHETFEIYDGPKLAARGVFISES